MVAKNYDAPQTEVYKFAAQAFGNSTKTFTLIGPKGRTGYVKDILVDITADMVGATTVPEVQVGVSGTLAKYARYRLGSSATSGYTAASTPKRATQEAITGNPPPSLTDFAGHVLLEVVRMPADTAFLVTLVAGTGGSPAGTADVSVIVDWY